ncbi:MAG: amino acid ABC transporter permease [Gammaproteobacteria bacterium]|nr:amino acid ABC transporter permease [Gammaproteobacteria bacterium]
MSNPDTRGGSVYAGDLPDLPAPIRTEGPVAWLRDNLFSSVTNSVLTVVVGLLVLWYLPPVIDWVLVSANWGGGADACRANPDVACWPFVQARWEQFLYGLYEKSERWRIDILLVVLAIGIALLVFEKTPGRKYIAIFMLVIYPILAFFLLYGNETLGLPIVDTPQWGGFTLTLVIALSGIVASLPLGVVLALGRRSNMPLISLLSTIFIEFWRGIPLVAVLFMATIMFPLFLPPDMKFDQLLRAVIGVALFASAYMAEVVRGGLQAIPKGQYEGAMALGLPYWKMMWLVILPQALKIVIPGIVNTFIGLFKDTTLVLIISLFDLLGIVQASIADPNWSIKSVPYTGYVFVAIVFWICCYFMARYSRYIEAKLHTGHKR